MGRKDRGGLRLATGGATLPGPHATSGDFLTESWAFLPPAPTTCPCRYHQQYLAKNPFGYRCHTNTGARFPQTASRPMIECDLIGPETMRAGLTACVYGPPAGLLALAAGIMRHACDRGSVAC